MYEEDERSYVQAHCHLSNSLRIFRIDRILSCIALDKINLGGHALDKTNLIERTSSQKNENNQIPYEIRVISATRDIAERFGIQSVLKEQGNQVGQLVQLQSFSEEWVERAVLATGADIELTRPAEIRREVYNRAKSLFNRYTSK
jgi:predicted DNA-binding transcriptional regulator YafY